MRATAAAPPVAEGLRYPRHLNETDFKRTELFSVGVMTLMARRQLTYAGSSTQTSNARYHRTTTRQTAQQTH